MFEGFLYKGCEVALVRFECNDRVNTAVRACVGRDILEEMNLSCVSIDVLRFLNDRYRRIVTVLISWDNDLTAMITAYHDVSIAKVSRPRQVLPGFDARSADLRKIAGLAKNSIGEVNSG